MPVAANLDVLDKANENVGLSELLDALAAAFPGATDATASCSAGRSR